MSDRDTIPKGFLRWEDHDGGFHELVAETLEESDYIEVEQVGGGLEVQEVLPEDGPATV